MMVRVGLGTWLIAVFFLALLIGYVAFIVLAGVAVVLLVAGVRKMLGR